ncbi:MAG: hypothetical protein IJ638_01570 [Alphaproteobacteria bacterium]|nr:hypothetical protein [Alphaproteobacteria bacterium]
MKKIMAILLFFIFANFGFVPVWAASNTKNILEIKVEKDTVSNLKSAVSVFEGEYSNFCKDFSESKICCEEFSEAKGCSKKKEFSQYANSVAIRDAKFDDKNEKFFDIIYGFWDELTAFQETRDKDKKAILSKRQNALISQIVALKNKINLDEL